MTKHYAYSLNSNPEKLDEFNGRWISEKFLSCVLSCLEDDEKVVRFDSINHVLFNKMLSTDTLHQLNDYHIFVKDISMIDDRKERTLEGLKELLKERIDDCSPDNMEYVDLLVDTIKRVQNI